MSFLGPFLRQGAFFRSGAGSRTSSSAAAGLRDALRPELDSIRAAGTWKTERVITTPQAAAIRVQEREGDVLNFCANNYLGLSVRSLAALLYKVSTGRALIRQPGGRGSPCESLTR